MELALTHERADFDAIASLVALARLRPGLVPVLPVVINQNVRHFLALYGGGLGLVSRDAAPRSGVERLWFVDTDTAQWPKGVRHDVARSVVDHHSKRAEGVGGPDPSVGANVTLLVEQLVAAGTQPTLVESTLFLLGIYEDTGGLSYAGTTARDLRAAAWLLDQGADLRVARRFLGESLSAGAHALFTALADEAKVYEIAGRQVIVAAAQARGFTEELSPLASRLAELHAADALFVVVDLGDRVQVVARSRVDGIDAAAVAESLGGGGHPRAAAAVLDDALLEDVVKAVLSAVRAVARPAAVVADIMSRGPIKTVEASQPVSEAAALAALHGHEGYPVVDDDVLVGMLTRQDLDRAIRHGLHSAPVRQIAHLSPTRVVHPDTSVDALQDVMLGEGAGQLPVVDAGRVVGIVTRTDLLKLWSKGRTRPDRIRVDLDRALSTARRRAVRQVADAARAAGERAYVVGGVPRDLLLEVPPGPDVDIVVDGDAVALARGLAESHGGRVTTHERFGTAKWFLPDAEGETLDLATARTEYYETATALPGVTRGSIESDLRRRDFTVNTLAADIDPERYGEVLDLFGGVADLEARQLRVLHSLSFIEDPTRILRAARLCIRLGFRLEQRTETQARHAADLLARVSGARVRNELIQVFAEPDPLRVLRLLDELGALTPVDAALRPSAIDVDLSRIDHATEVFELIRPELAIVDRNRDPGRRLAFWLAAQAATDTTLERLALPGRLRDTVHTMDALERSETLADNAPTLVVLHRSLSGIDPADLALAWAAGRPQVRASIERFLREAYGVKLRVTGHDLTELGFRPSDAFSVALGKVLEAVLEGRVHDRAGELEIAVNALGELGASRE